MTYLVWHEEEECYLNPLKGYSMRRESGKTPNGNRFANRWVLRQFGRYVDHDQYRFDLAGRNNIELL